MLEDIRDAASFILADTEAKSLADYSTDRLLRQAVERNFEIIGEALGRLLREDPGTAFRLSERRRIVSFRHVLIHGYDLVDDELVWDTIKTKLPVLLSEVEDLLEAEPRPKVEPDGRGLSAVVYLVPVTVRAAAPNPDGGTEAKAFVSEGR